MMFPTKFVYILTPRIDTYLTESAGCSLWPQLYFQINFVFLFLRFKKLSFLFFKLSKTFCICLFNFLICKLLYKFEDLIYFSPRLNHHIQDEVLRNGRMLQVTLLLVWSLHWLGNFSVKMLILIQFLQIFKCWKRFESEMILLFSMKT